MLDAQRRMEARAAGACVLLAAGLSGIALGVARISPPRTFDVREAMVPMRDGVRLHTLVFVPRGGGGKRGVVLARSPYGLHTESELAKTDYGKELASAGYVVVEQSMRGRYLSEGTFDDMRPLHDPGDARGTDDATDAYDTIDWIVRNVPEQDGRVCLWGASYLGWSAAIAVAAPHPALACVVDQAPISDYWAGDDDHHNGVFHLWEEFEWAAEFEKAAPDFDYGVRDLYDFYLRLGSLANADARYFHGRSETFTRARAHPDRDAYWEARALGPHLANASVPVLTVGGWWDQEDPYGPFDIYRHLEAGPDGARSHLVIGPWSHASWLRGPGKKLGDVDFGAETGVEYRARIERAWLARWLKGEGADDFPDARVFETGSNRWRTFDAWPPRSGVTPLRLYLREGGALATDAPEDADAADAYVSDPAKPVPSSARPIRTNDWSTWLVQDQRFADGRPDVLTYVTGPLDHDVVVAGDVTADLFASTTGADADWVVKLIDVMPEGPEGDEEPAASDLRGFELMVAGDVVRARYRDDPAHPTPLTADEIVHYPIDLHPRSHAFAKGHRIMVQVQSSWFPAFDRNPQSWVANVYAAKDGDFVKATQRVHRSKAHPSSVVLPVLAEAAR